MKLERTFIPYTPIAKNLIVRYFEERGPIGHKPLNKTNQSIYCPIGHKPLNKTCKDAYYVI